MDQIEREFERAIQRVEDQDNLLKSKNEQIEELKKQNKTDKKTSEIDGKKLKACVEMLTKADQRLGTMLST